ncbi:MAG: hypothetical protein ACLFQX_08070 [Candidatus Kapaibacterium sp.]
MKKLLFIIALFAFLSCEEALGPNEIGGSTDVEFSKPGSEFGISLTLGGNYNKALSAISDSVVITKNDNGIVTLKGIFTTNQENMKNIDTLLGTQELTDDMKRQVFDSYKEKFGFTIDTSDKDNLKLEFEIKGKITSEGIQDFVYSKGDESKPFTVAKYSAKVGDKYEFTTEDGEKITREVTYRSTEDDYSIAFWLIKVIKVEQTMNDPVIEKITYYANHKFGLVGMEATMKDGRMIKSTIMPPNL